MPDEPVDREPGIDDVPAEPDTRIEREDAYSVPPAEDGDAIEPTGRGWYRRPTPGWTVVARKELADHLLSVRFSVLLLLVGLTAAGAVYAAAGAIRDVASEASGTPSLFIRMFTVAPEGVPSFLTLVGWLVPLLGIALGFDAVNGERSQGTLPRLVSQPIHRDDVINGKFAAGLAVIASILFGISLLIAGVGMLRLGIVPSPEEIARLILWLLLTIVYAGLWLGFATMVSVALRRAATSALVTIATWLVLTVFGGFIFGIVADALAPMSDPPTAEEQIANANMEVRLSRLSPSVLYEEATFVLLRPDQRFVGIVLPQQLDLAIPEDLPLTQSLLVVWPQVVVLVGLTVICFAYAYVMFMRQEIRA